MNKNAPALVALMLCASAAAYAQQSAPLRLLQTTPLPRVHGRIDHFAADIAGNRLFMSALGNDTVEVFDLRSARLLHTIPGLAEPQGVTYVRESEQIFVANGGDGTVRIFDGRDYRLRKIIHLGSDADDTRYDAARNQVWVGYGGGSSAGLTSLDGTRGDVLATIALPGHPESFQLEEHGSLIYVNIPSAGNTIAVVNRDQRHVIATWTLGGAGGNFPMALDEAGHRLFVVARDPAEMLALDTNTGKIVAQVPCVARADDMWWDARHRRIYVSGGAGFISVIAQQGRNHYSRIAEIRTASGGRTSLFVPQLGRLYLGIWGRGGAAEELRMYAVLP